MLARIRLPLAFWELHLLEEGLGKQASLTLSVYLLFSTYCVGAPYVTVLWCWFQGYGDERASGW